MSDIEVPQLVIDESDQSANVHEADAVDLANVVQSAVKGLSTVQEAPAIVTVVTDADIKDRQFHDLQQLYDTVPGWNRVGFGNSLFHAPTVRGQVQAVQFLRDGISLFDPFVNTPAARAQPMEIIKQVEMITGPGGVLWGANSLLGILNVITKDAEDVDGVEVGGTLGNGVGDRMTARTYAMAGVISGDFKVFAHGSIETYRGAQLEQPLLLFQTPPPQPDSANIYGPLTSSDQARSILVNLDTKITYKKLVLRLSVPFGEQYEPLGISGAPSREHLYEDASCNGTTTAGCVDPMGTARKNRADSYDRFAALEYHTRFANDRAGITVRAYGVQFVRGLLPMQFLAPSALVPGGLSLNVDLTSYRVGAATDGDVELASKLRLLFGTEVFDEFKTDNASRSNQGPGTESTFPGPSDLTRLPVLCPRIYDQASMTVAFVPNCPLLFAFPAKRTVLGAYLNPQWRPSKTVTVDLGGRVQAAPASPGSLSYDVNTTVAGTVVWNFLRDWHMKLNYAEGFRPPVMNNAVSNGEAANIAGDPNLRVETSSAGQFEINARVFKGDRRIRELSFRVDGSYTRLDNLIQVTTGQYHNSGERGLASGELLAKLFVKGGHRFELGYTWLQVATSDRGRIRSTPENWFNFATVFSLITGRLTATTNLKVAGAAEDPDRLVEYRDLGRDANGIPSSIRVAETDLVSDRLPPVAELTLGVSYTPTAKLTIQATVYDALYAHNYEPDVFSDFSPHIEYLPNPYEGFRAYVSAGYRY